MRLPGHAARARRRAAQRATLAAYLLANPGQRHVAWEAAKGAGVSTRIVYPLMWRWLEIGWLEDSWEERPGDRPPRRYYRVTESGQENLGNIRRAWVRSRGLT